MNIRYLFSYPTSLAMKLLLFRLLCKFGVSHLKKLDPWGLATPEALPWKIEGFSRRVRKGHESRLSRTCHWRRGRMPAAVRSRCIRQRTTRFTEIAASGLFLWEQGVELPTCKLHTRKPTTVCSCCLSFWELLFHPVLNDFHPQL